MSTLDSVIPANPMPNAVQIAETEIARLHAELRTTRRQLGEANAKLAVRDRELDAALAQRQEVREPIETAPRDGTPILLFFGQDTATAGWFVLGAKDEYPWAFIDTGLVGIDTGLNHAREGRYGPSHWAPFSALASLAARSTPAKEGE